MPRNTYPETITYFGQLIRSRLSMKSDFKIERKAMRTLSFDEPDNFYLSPEQQELHALKYSEELHNFVTSAGSIVIDNQYNFILTCEQNPRLIVSESMHHSAMANGKKVLASGSLIFKDGYLIKMTNHSGHYCPKDDEMLDVIKALHTASNGTLYEYYSYCTPEPLLYSVKELIHADRFEQLTPIATDEIIHPETGKREKCGYDFKMGNGALGSRNRFGAGLKPERISVFEHIIKSRFTLFESTEQPSSSSESSVQQPFKA
ncbi:hypothetical protein [Legionella quateirensis]|uniref:Uncharacterized protein n=1 Tax=Legionella quateirensis TaxID=45072 RepID=A0A378KUH3_9GAMM|nr:hypothetical protein [Legionella quateirensis]KTD44833.1 hypothetical protein Lqua_2668 [Legionella quateirensis]STY17261.1 Uncharacterised protein [Legionella quateirensis]